MKIHFLDDNLIDYSGHNGDYIFSIVNELELNNIEYYISANKLAIDFLGFKVDKVFDLATKNISANNIIDIIAKLFYTNLFFLKNLYSIRNVSREANINIVN